MKHAREIGPNSKDSAGHKYRAARFRLFQAIVDEVIAEKNSCRILDVGGTAGYWESFGQGLDWSNVHITILNLDAPPTTRSDVVTVSGDARNMKEFADQSFDVVHSNSVIEHLGRWDYMAAMAAEVRRLAPRYFLQTPYFWFPIEPHARFPLLHWMPESWRYRILMRRSCGFWQRQPDLGQATKAIQSALLLDKQQMQYLFPDATIRSERVFGLTKSLMAMKRGSAR
jgi:hypothetical protein